jgi:hypothetical protein
MQVVATLQLSWVVGTRVIASTETSNSPIIAIANLGLDALYPASLVPTALVGDLARSPAASASIATIAASPVTEEGDSTSTLGKEIGAAWDESSSVSVAFGIQSVVRRVGIAVVEFVVAVATTDIVSTCLEMATRQGDRAVLTLGKGLDIMELQEGSDARRIVADRVVAVGSAFRNSKALSRSRCRKGSKENNDLIEEHLEDCC